MSFRQMLFDRENFIHMLQKYIIATTSLDTTCLKALNDTLIENGNRQDEEDIIYTMAMGEKDIFFYILFTARCKEEFSVYLYSRLKQWTERLRNEGHKCLEIIPIVIYNQSLPWTSTCTFPNEKGYGEISPQFFLVDIFRLDACFIKNTTTDVDNIFLIERAKTEIELFDILKERKSMLSTSEIGFVTKWLTNALLSTKTDSIKEVLLDGDIEELRPIINDILEENYNKGIRKGLLNERCKTAERMKQLGYPSEMIRMVTEEDELSN